MNIHGQIMNLQMPSLAEHGTAHSLEYKMGHRDARHAAAELALKADACIESLRQMVQMMDSGDEHGSGLPWHIKAVAALAAVDAA